MVARPNPDHDEPQALPRNCQPVTLPLAEAAEAIPLILVSAASRQCELLALLPVSPSASSGPPWSSSPFRSLSTTWCSRSCR